MTIYSKYFEFLKKNKNIFLLTIIYLIAFIYLMHILKILIQFGGIESAYQQGDWLINNENVIIRRGLFGSLLLNLSDLLSINPLHLLGLIQGIITFIIYSTLWYIGLKYKYNDIVFFLLFSPLFVLFGFNYPFASFRKESLVYLAIMPLLWASFEKNRNKNIIFVSISVIIYSVAVFSHEANTFFLPFLILMLYLLRKKADSTFYIFSLVYSMLALCGILYAKTYSSIENYMIICQPLLNRGLDIHICDGAIKWLSRDLNYAISEIRVRIQSKSLFSFIFSYAVSLLIFLALLKYYFRSKYILLFCVISSLCYLPLYITATEWGRWINYYVFSVTGVFLMYILNQDSSKDDIHLSRSYYILLLILSSLFAMPVHLAGDNITLGHGYIYNCLILIKGLISKI